MNYIFVFLFIAIALAAFGILFYVLRRRSGIGSIGANEEQNRPDSAQNSNLAGNEIKRFPVNNELVQLRQHLNTIVMHNERVYQNNIEIARRDFVKRGLQNPSETELLKRAIEIWQDDNGRY